MNSGTRVSLYFKCVGLKDTDTFSKSDPYIVVYQPNSSGKLNEVGRTETIMNDLNPVFQKSVTLDYLFEVKQEFVIRIFDDDGGKTDDANDALGVVPFCLAHIMCSKGHTKDFAIPAPLKGTLTVTAVDHATTGEDTIQLAFYGRNLKKMDFIGDSDPYFILSRRLPNGQKTIVYQSEVIDDNLNPRWKPLPTLKVANLMGKDSNEKTLEFECFDKDVFGQKGMGCVQLSLDDLLQASCNASAKFFELRKDHKKENLYGYIHCSKCEIIRRVTFQDLMAGGWQINTAVAVDFTASNGEPRDPKSLHFNSPGVPNEYVRAIMSVCEILMDYDYDKNVAAFGFGAILPDGKESHHFHLNLEPNPYVFGVAGILQAYQRAVNAVRLYGPTNFAPTIINIVAGARQAEKDHIYTILLILTDGEITDIDDTIDALVQADDAALSIIIIGVGNGSDFAAMNQLDGDNAALSSRGRVSRRDLVQFVPMRDFVNRPAALLAAEVLREVPSQVERWAAIKNLRKEDVVPQVALAQQQVQQQKSAQAMLNP